VRIFVTRAIPDAGLEILKRASGVELAIARDDEPVPREKVLEGVRRADVLVSLLTETIDREFLEAVVMIRGV
jgi:hypothetical protein